MNRRQFISTTVPGVALAATTARAARKTTDDSTQAKTPSPNDRVRFGLIGAGGRGSQVSKTLLKHGVSFPVICDVNQLHSGKVNTEIFGGKAAMVEDCRRIFDRQDIDAVLITSPDHWHAIHTIQACQAGKDVYVEKPVCYCIAEGPRMIAAARKYGRVVQVGSQQLSGAHYQEAARIVQSGGIGKISHVRAWNVGNHYPGIGFPPDEPTPDTINWDMYLGPAPLIPYNPVKATGKYRCFWSMGGGIMTDWGAHHVGSVHQIIGVTHPLSAAAVGGKYVIKDLYETPDTFTVVWEYPDFAFEFTWRDGNGYAPDGCMYGIAFHGTDACLYIDRVGFEIIPEKDRNVEPRKVGHPRVDIYNNPAMELAHTGNFLECMRTRALPVADIEVGYRAVVGPHLGNISLRTGRKIVWNNEQQTIAEGGEAAALLSRIYRSPYLLPEV